ncbi:MAG: hypothetical protein EOP11_10950 [Proteobacteria bacterium]|nr:MAG: hypothetical protein EOP11_10950 [Pseudomonadota bacterium]
MKKYRNLGGGSNVAAYEITADAITIKFIDGTVHTYDAKKPGAAHVAQMKVMALAGKGLFDYIKRYVKSNHAK